ncbi:sigma factor-like helix-turn-helix DNA-binding protein (plasmid) [Sphingobium sp. V4]|uniref:sigma factor-like helix-turn-helix DNA-binding protein n=1 Tax=Sphingobium sp. V4 TaxID=3038927 RepID=UPI0025581F5C|nr:sigma factor-like helix-turn-helix DNA-binding protein [Sphingobium sp. V4]WIW90516.1 sigma factor-like helix-turn-helix DNA-binding protein [Sphingobium sp. V4]
MKVYDPERTEKAKAALARMPKRTLDIFIANQVEGLSYVEIARREGLFLWQVRRHMLRAIHIIAREMR